MTIRKLDLRRLSRFPTPAKRNPVTRSSSPMTANKEPSEEAATAAAETAEADISRLFLSFFFLVVMVKGGRKGVILLGRKGREKVATKRRNWKD